MAAPQKSRIWIMPVLTISPVCLLYSSIVSDVLSLSVDTIQGDIKLRNCKVAVLFNDTLSLFLKLLVSQWLPPVFNFT